MILTISIIVMGDQPLIIRCLESIQAETQVEYEIYVVNNLAPPEILKEIAQRFPEVKFIHNTQRLSFAANNNLVMQRAKGKFVLLLNDDTIILEQALDRMVNFLSCQPSEIGIVGCTNLNRESRFTLACHPFPEAKTIFWQQTRLNRWFPGYLHDKYLFRAKNEKEPFCVDWASGSCMLIRREVIDQIGYLDEDFFLYGEEVDYCYRALQNGFLTYYYPQAQIIHYESISTAQFLSLKLKGHYLSKLYFLAKHGYYRDLRLVRVLFIIELILKSFIRGVGALIDHPPDALERLKIYLALIYICATYRGQPALELINDNRHLD